MSDNQKLLISVLGAVIGHLLLLFVLAVLFTIANLLAPTRGEAAALPTPAPPEEVTILLSDLMEQVEMTPKDLTQQYMRTDADQESDVAPEDAPFHSNRNTLAQSSRTPDPSDAKRKPSVDGRTDLPFLEIRDREWVDGEFLDTSAPSAPSPATKAAPAIEALPTEPAESQAMAAAKPTPLRDPSEIETEKELKSEADPSETPREAPDAKPQTPAEADTPPDRVAEQKVQPDARELTAASLMAQREDSFDTPFPADTAQKPEEIAEKDREAEGIERTQEFAEAAAPETPEAASAMPVARPLRPTPQQNAAAAPAEPTPAQSASADVPPTQQPPSTDPAFNPHTRAREMDGGASQVGNTPSFDVESSAMGKYKKAVTDAVERQWHRYREKNLDYVTYGTLKVKFRVDKSGKPRNLKLVKNDANAVMAEFTLRAVLDAEIPEMPEEVASMLGPSGLEISYDVIVY
ncbi:MAG: hypothetical protein KDN19_03240 [Verrucomicrobiae bacterium]|nr:hypothetical protein [Verrucomicrobiae bacterium]